MGSTGLCSDTVGCYECGSMPNRSFTSSNTNQLMPAAGATLARLGRIPCR
jgi:hypothetical protein